MMRFRSRLPFRPGLLLALSVLAGAGLAACTTPSPPSRPDNICAIYREKRNWYHAAMRAERKYHIPSSIPLAMMYQESSFRSNVHSPRTYILWVIPWGHVSSAYGYAQAENGVWREYQRYIGHSADRTSFSDAFNFMNWYMLETRRKARVSVRDAVDQYLAYHEGWGGYMRRSFTRKPGLRAIARRVGRRASRYEAQYAGCLESLKDHGFWLWLWYNVL